MKDPWKKLISNSKSSGRRANAMTLKRRGIELPFEIKPEDLKNIYDAQNEKCYWFAVKLDPMLIFDKHNPLSMSVDRLDNEKGYKKDNIVICCRLANLGRQNCDIEKFKSIVEYLKAK
jgi:hypothetical protein